jgi:Natural resistance-associated macrophage protein
MSLFFFSLITVIQEMCARIGLLSGNGLAALIKKKYSAKIVYLISSLVLITTTINIGADFGAISASIKLKLIFPEIPFGANDDNIPYLLFWQTSEEAEEHVAKHRIKEIGQGKSKISPGEILSMKEDVGIDILFLSSLCGA